MVYRQQIYQFEQTTKNINPQKIICSIILRNLKSLLIFSNVLYLNMWWDWQKTMSEDTDKCSGKMEWPVNQYGGGGYMCVLSSEKPLKTPAEDNTCIIYVRHFLVIHWWEIHRQTLGVLSVSAWVVSGICILFYFIVFSILSVLVAKLKTVPSTVKEGTKLLTSYACLTDIQRQ